MPTLNLLLVDDSEDDTLLLLRELKRGGFEAQYRRVDTEQAMREALEEGPWDAVISDYSMPSFSGHDALAALKDYPIDVPFIIVSGAIGEETAVQLMREGAHDYIAKENLARLCVAIERELQEAANRRERQHALEELTFSENRYRRLVENLSHEYFFYSLNSEGVFDYISPSLTNILGYALDEFIGHYTEVLGDISKNSDAIKYTELSLQGIQQPLFEVDVRHKDGSTRRLEVLEVPIGSENGNTVSIEGIAHDITVRKKADDDLRLAAQVFEHSVEGIMITDADNRIIRVNRAFTDITGYSEEEALGNTPSMLRSGHQDSHIYEKMWHSISENDMWNGEIWNRRKNGEIYPELLNISVIRDDNQAVSNYIGVFNDLTERKQAQEDIHRLSHYDALTNLPNRQLVIDRLLQSLEAAERKGRQLAVLYLDLDRLMMVNDSLGHHAGDLVLVEVSKRFSGMLGEWDTIGRMGGDEFAVILPMIQGPDQVTRVVQRMLETLATPFPIDDQEVFITASIGIALYPSDGTSVEDLLKNADSASHHAKKNRNSYKYFTPEMQAQGFKRLIMENSLHRALENEEFQLYYQPQVDLKTLQMIGAEALIRWVHPDIGLVSPAEFIPLLEETGLIIPVGEWIIHEACRHIREWQGLGYEPVTVSVNLSAHQFRQKYIAKTFKNALKNSAVNPRYMKIELTESGIMHDVENVLSVLNELHEMGVGISVDDFGTGYSSLSYLKRFPIDTLKIDQSFIHDLEDDIDDRAIVNAIIAMGHSLNMELIAEGVETDEQLNYLRSQGCDAVQGYLFGRPVPADEFIEKHLKARQLSKTVG